MASSSFEAIVFPRLSLICWIVLPSCFDISDSLLSSPSYRVCMFICWAICCSSGRIGIAARSLGVIETKSFKLMSVRPVKILNSCRLCCRRLLYLSSSFSACEIALLRLNSSAAAPAMAAGNAGKNRGVKAPKKMVSTAIAFPPSAPIILAAPVRFILLVRWVIILPYHCSYSFFIAAFSCASARIWRSLGSFGAVLNSFSRVVICSSRFLYELISLNTSSRFAAMYYKRRFGF